MPNGSICIGGKKMVVNLLAQFAQAIYFQFLG
jgi:hypothetical protein